MESETFKTIDEVRARYYPDSAPLLKLEAEEAIDFPMRLAEDSLAAISQIASRARKQERIADQQMHDNAE